MKILLAGQTFGPVNGPGVFTRNIARGLSARGHEVVVAIPSARLRTTERADGAIRVCEVRGVSLAPLYPDVAVTIAAGAPARRIVDAFEPDVIHVQDHYPLSRAFVRAGKLRSVPIVATNHFLPENMTAQTWFGRAAPLRSAFDAISWKLVRNVLNAARVVTAPTRTAAAILERHGVRRPVRAISCGVDTARFIPLAVERVAADGIAAIYVGRLDADKDVATLVRAIDSAAGIMLVVCGKGREERRLRAIAGNRVVFTGFVADDELPALLSSADFFAIAGRAELQSIATLEAMACGLPVVAADALALPELVTRERGELFRAGDPADAARAMHALVARRACWPEIARRCRAVALEHDIARTVVAYEDLYSSL